MFLEVWTDPQLNSETFIFLHLHSSYHPGLVFFSYFHTYLHLYSTYGINKLSLTCLLCRVGELHHMGGDAVGMKKENIDFTHC